MESGDVYVADTGNSRIAEFESDGTFLRNFGSQAAPTFVAVDNSGGGSPGSVYVGDPTAGTVLKYDAEGTPVSGWGEAGRLGGFSEMQGIGVAPDGDLFILNGASFGEVMAHRFDPTGAAVGTPFLAAENGSSPSGLAIDGEGNLYRITGSEEVLKFSASGTSFGVVSNVTPAKALATVPAAAELYELGGGRISRFAVNCGQRCTPTESFGEGELGSPSGLAVDNSGGTFAADAASSKIAVYGVVNVEPPTVTLDSSTGITGTTAHFIGHINPSAPVGDPPYYDVNWEFECHPGCGGAPHGSIPADAESHEVEATITGLLPGTIYEVFLVASNAGNKVVTQPLEIETLVVAPEVLSEQAREVTTGSATFAASIRGGGGGTTYQFEYLPRAAYEAEGGFLSSRTVATEAQGPLPVDNEVHQVESAQITGLTPETQYVFRAVATNSAKTEYGRATFFATQSSALPPQETCENQSFRIGVGPALPDCRAYELVSPADKQGAGVEGFQDLLLASPTGDRALYYNGSVTGIPASGEGRQEFSALLASRIGDAWGTQRLLPPAADGEQAAFIGASPNLRYAILEATKNGFGPGSGRALLELDTTTGAITELVAYERNQLATRAGSSGGEVGSYSLDGVSEDGRQVFFETIAPVSAGAIEGVDNLFVWDSTTGEVSLAGVLPGAPEETPELGAFGGAHEWFLEPGNLYEGGALKGLYVEALNAISPDGDQIYFTAAGTGQLYLREGIGAGTPTTVRVSAPNPGVAIPAEERPASFLEATPDGSMAFFMSSQKLSQNANTGVSEEGSDLYRWDKAEGEVVDVTPSESAGTPGGAEVQGLLGTSSDGRSGYFVAKGNLAPGGTAGQNNLYRFQEEVGGFVITFIATLAPGGPGEAVEGLSDARDWSPKSYGGSRISPPEPFAKSARVSADGRTVLFTSRQPLTGYDNKACGEDRNLACAEIFMATIGSPTPVCISCDPTGAAPLGDAELSTSFLNANLTPRSSNKGVITSNLTDGGQRVFFQTPDPLVSTDTNGEGGCGYYLQQAHRFGNCQDVYEWEKAGTPGGTCRDAEVNGGCLYLLSSGKSKQPSYFVGSSGNGADVFLATASQLVPTDRDELFDVYDARVEGGSPSQFVPPPEPCGSSEDCRAPDSLAAPAQGAATSTFQGSGNPASSHSHKAKKKHHRKQKHKKQARKGHKTKEQHKSGSSGIAPKKGVAK